MVHCKHNLPVVLSLLCLLPYPFELFLVILPAVIVIIERKKSHAITELCHIRQMFSVNGYRLSEAVIVIKIEQLITLCTLWGETPCLIKSKGGILEIVVGRDDKNLFAALLQFL